MTSGVGPGEPSQGGATKRTYASTPAVWPKAEEPSSPSTPGSLVDPDGTARWSPVAEWVGPAEGNTWHQRASSWDDEQVDPPGWSEAGRSLDQLGPGPAGRTRRPNGHWPELVILAAVAVIIAAAALAITSANRPSLPSHPGGPSAISHRTSTSPPTSSPGRGTTLRDRSSTAPNGSQPATSAPIPVAGGAIALAVTPALQRKLVSSWLAANPGNADLAPKDVAGTAPGQVHYGYDPATATYWAEAAFQPSASVVREASTAAGQVKLEQFQGWLYVFSLKQGPLWTWVGDVEAGACPNQYVPATVLAAWHLCGYSPAPVAGPGISSRARK